MVNWYFVFYNELGTEVKVLTCHGYLSNREDNVPE